jgi:CRISPR/Cas system Type II protein with McrA/HNH and RuvC-like nuclease domain
MSMSSAIPLVGNAVSGGKNAKRVAKAVDNIPGASHMTSNTANAVGGVGHNAQDVKQAIKGKPFTQSQKKKLIDANKEKNGGKMLSEQSGKELLPAQKSQKGVIPSPDEVQIDHIIPRSKGGTNSLDNAQVISRAENRAKSDTMPPLPKIDLNQ